LSKTQHWQDFWRRTIIDFFNSIRQKRSIEKAMLDLRFSLGGRNASTLRKVGWCQKTVDIANDVWDTLYCFSMASG
jgi:hypothetical protein